MGTTLALLGKNGAGKTTLVNILTGKLMPTSGDAEIFGHSIITEMSKILSEVSLCPQNDVLWPFLTAKEHLTIMKRLKKDDKLSVDDVLRKIGLSGSSNKHAKNFSGGMKRRLQVAMTVFGRSKLLVLDEPTTGVDPVNRRKIWNLLREIKKDKITLLTTHSMEEAEILGEKIAIIVDGKLRTVGSSLHLKNKHSSGYRLQIIPVQGKQLMIEGLIEDIMPDAILTEQNSNNLIYSVHVTDEERVTKLLTTLRDLTRVKGSSSDDDVIVDWGWSHATLEEVFLNVAR